MRNLVYFIKNIFRFRKALWQYREWEYESILLFQKEHLVLLRDSIQNSCMKSVNYQKQIKRIDEMSLLVDRLLKDDYRDMYLTFGDILSERLGDGHWTITDLSVRRKKGVNHKRVDSEKQKEQDWNRLNYLVNKYGRGLWN